MLPIISNSEGQRADEGCICSLKLRGCGVEKNMKHHHWRHTDCILPEIKDKCNDHTLNCLVSIYLLKGYSSCD